MSNLFPEFMELGDWLVEVDNKVDLPKCLPMIFINPDWSDLEFRITHKQGEVLRFAVVRGTCQVISPPG